MQKEQELIAFAKTSYQPTITKVNDRIYHFLGYGHSNAIAIIGDASVILIDTLDSDVRAEKLKQAIKDITSKQVETIIYTHSHPDHLGGAGAFQDTVKEIIAHTSVKPALPHYDKLQHVLAQRGAFQHGYGLSDEEAICQGIGIREGKEVKEGVYAFLPATTIYDEPRVIRCIDGVQMEFVATPGESDDQMLIWLSEDQVICTGDTYYGCFPALYAIRGTQYRDIASWIESLKKILSYDAQALLPGHTQALLTHQLIQEQVGTYQKALEHILFTTLEYMDQGYTLEEVVQRVSLPKEDTQLAYLQEYYGMVEWAVKSIYVGYVGWFDGNPAKLLPVPEQTYHQRLLELIGEEALLDNIHTCMDQEEYQLALQLLELIDHKELTKKCLLQRAKQVSSANARHYLIASAKRL